MNPTLLILAAGLGSRYGGIKQMDQIGPSGESIIDYSVYDAIRAGFGKVVFVLNPDIIDDFRSLYEARLKGRMKTEYILQEISDIPEGISFNPGRIKPWGTAHAVLVAKNYIGEPFAVINADDFYGKETYSVMASYLKGLSLDDTNYSMVGYRLKNTLSENGTVSRGICTSDNQFLVHLVERTKIYSENGNIVFEENGSKNNISGESVVSMNFWGFTPRLFVQMENDFRSFIEENSNNLAAEFYIPFVVNKLINAKKAGIKVLASEASWFGVTYKEDKDTTIEKVGMLIDKGIYPAKLW